MDYYFEMKNELINNEINKRIKDYSKNKNDLNTRYNVGKLLSEAGKQYGEAIIKEYSIKLTHDLNKKYSIRTLYKMQKFYNTVQKLPTLSANLSWSHYDEIIMIDNIESIKYYIKITEEHSLSVRELRKRIKSKEYDRLDEQTKIKLINEEPVRIQDYVKNPILIYNKSNYEIISEKVLQRLILEDIPSFLNELGVGFTFIKNEYKIRIGNNYNYIDLLLFNIEYNCYVVVELKITELKKEHIGQIEIYMNYIDKNLRKIVHDKTIGIIVCKKNDEFVIEYCSDSRIIGREYKIVL